MWTKDLLRKHAFLQGEEYSRKMREEYETLWGSFHWDFVRQQRAKWMVYKAQRLFKRDMSPWKVLEVGCGIGFTTLEVARLGLSCIESLLAIDTSTDALKIAKDLLAKAEPEVKSMVLFREDNFFDHTGGPYHLIYMHEVFEHIPDFQSIFEQANALLCPGGLFMVSTPNGSRLSNRLLNLLGREPLLLDPYHIKEYTPSELLTGGTPLIPLALSGRILLDELVLGGLLSFGSKALFKRLRPLVVRLIQTRANYYAGTIAPSLSSELMLLYRKDLHE